MDAMILSVTLAGSFSVAFVLQKVALGIILRALNRH
jgi:hypothetical protein